MNTRVANGTSEYTVDPLDTWKDRKSGKTTKKFTVAPGRMVFLIKE